MKSGSRRRPSAAEHRRATRLHEFFIRIHESGEAMSLLEMHRRAARDLPGRTFRMTSRQFRNVCRRWQADRRPESLVRRRSGGRATRDLATAMDIVRLAILKRTSLRTAWRFFKAAKPEITGAYERARRVCGDLRKLRRLRLLEVRRIAIQREMEEVEKECLGWIANAERKGAR